jgi:hypothetical protein
MKGNCRGLPSLLKSSMKGVLLWIIGIAIVSAQSPDCDVQRGAFVDGGVAQAKMTVVNKGVACVFEFKFGGNFAPDEWKVIEAPKHGKIEAGGSSARFLPESGYTGTDAFVVEVFGSNAFAGRKKVRNGSFAFQVDIRAAP